LHTAYGSLDAFIIFTYQRSNLLRGCLCLFRQFADFFGHHGKSSSGFAGARRLDRGVERQEVGLTRDALNETGHLLGGSLSFPLQDKIFLGGSAKYVHFTDLTGNIHTGFTFDAGLTLRLIPQVSIGAVGYNLLDRDTRWAPRAVGGGIAVLPLPTLLFVFDSVLEKVYGDSTRDRVMYYMGGGEISFASSFAVRGGGGHDGMSGNTYFSVGVSTLSADVGALDIGLRQDVSGQKKATIVGISARLFVPSM